MDFYTGKPDRPIEHYGVVVYSFQTSQASGIVKAFTDLFSNATVITQQSDEEALHTIKQLVLEKKPNANVIYDMNIAITHVPAQNSYCLITKIYASYGCYKD